MFLKIHKGPHQGKEYIHFNKWVPPTSRWYKSNTNVSRMESGHSTTINYVWWENAEKIVRKIAYPIGDRPVLVAETLASWKQ